MESRRVMPQPQQLTEALRYCSFTVVKPVRKACRALPGLMIACDTLKQLPVLPGRQPACPVRTRQLAPVEPWKVKPSITGAGTALGSQPTGGTPTTMVWWKGPTMGVGQEVVVSLRPRMDGCPARSTAHTPDS